MRDLPSPNFDERDVRMELNAVVLHYTGMKDEKTALERLCDPKSRVSAHYVVGEDGEIWKLVDESKRAWHAGQSFWRGVTDMNSASIGIELVNPGHAFGYRAFTEKQLAASIDLIEDIFARRKFNRATALLAHSDIAPMRKEDPGELFPWDVLTARGFGVYPNQPAGAGPMDEGEARKMLGSIGYDTSDLPAALRAFQRRYCPENITGQGDIRTVAMLKAVAACLRR